MKIYRYCGVFLLTLFLSVQLCTNVSAAESVQNSIGISELSGLTEYSYAAEPPVQFRLSHLSRRSEPL